MAEFNLEDYPEVEKKFNLEDYPEVPQEKSFLERAARAGLKTLPAIGAMGGGLIGAAAGGGVASPITGVAGAGLGMGAGKALENLIEQQILGDQKTREQIWTEPLKAIPEGATAEMGGQVIGKGVEAAIPYVQGAKEYVGNKVGDVAKNLSARVLGAERGTIKTLGADKVKKLGEYGLREKLFGMFSNTDDVIAANEAARKKGGELIDEAYSVIDKTGKEYFNPLDAATQVEKKIGDFYRSPINKGETSQFENTLESILMRGDKNIPLKEAQKLKEELGKVANWKNKVSITDKERMAREAYDVINSQIDDAVSAGMKDLNSDSLLPVLKRGKELWGNSRGASELLTNKLAREQGNKIVGLTDWGVLGAGGAVAPITGGASLPATAMIYGGKKYLEKYGVQQSALLFDKVSQQLLKSPQMAQLFAKNPSAFQALAQSMVQRMLPKQEEQQKPKYDNDAVMQKIKGTKYEQVLNNAKQNGDQSAAAAHYVLSNQDAEYRKLLEDEGE